MSKRYFFLFVIFLSSHPVMVNAQEKKRSLSDPPVPQNKKNDDQLLTNHLMIGWTGTWNQSDLGLSSFVGASLTYLFTRDIGMEVSFEFNTNLMEDKAMKDQESQVSERLSLAGLWFFNGIQTDHGFSPYGKLGVIHQSAGRYHSDGNYLEDISVPVSLQIGAGLMLRQSIFDLGVEVSAISPGFSVNNEMVNGSLNLRIFWGFHVDNLLWVLLIPLGFI